jgi:hypothetical protein
MDSQHGSGAKDAITGVSSKSGSLRQPDIVADRIDSQSTVVTPIKMAFPSDCLTPLALCLNHDHSTKISWRVQTRRRADAIPSAEAFLMPDFDRDATY